MPVAVVHIRFNGLVTPRFVNVPVVADTVPKEALEAVTSGVETDEPEMVPAEEIDATETFPRFATPVTVNAAIVVVARLETPVMVALPDKAKLPPEAFVNVRAVIVPVVALKLLANRLVDVAAERRALPSEAMVAEKLVS